MPSPAQSELRLLVVEDESLIALELEDLLTELGHKVVEVCGTVPRALAVVDRYADEIDGAILDANLGGTSASSVARLLKERRVPFVIASGYTADELRGLGLDGPRIGKPYRKQEVVSALADLKPSTRPL
jgi:DNA-binding response OmpR family regulator